ncbi:MAG: methyltransferase domain-containing protein [Rhizobacter sp.]|nr:methyltransferase domain-containing protein [Rhizobacter sp.]
MSWNPSQYLKFEKPRLRPALELLARVPLEAPRAVCDLGCGAGQLTLLMAQRWPQAQVVGVDSSAAMLQQAAATPAHVRWQQQDLAAWSPQVAPDLIYSNAALHWLPDHGALFPRLVAQLAPGGMLAVQMPRNFAAPSHTAIADTVMQGPWRERLAPLLRPRPVEAPDWYYDVLAPVATDIDLWETEYHQVLTGPDPVKEWTKGTRLATFLQALTDPAERDAFERDYAARVRVAYPPRDDGTTVFPFRRLFIVARRR